MHVIMIEWMHACKRVTGYSLIVFDDFDTLQYVD